MSVCSHGQTNKKAGGGGFPVVSIAYGLAKPAVAFLLRGQTQALQENEAMLAGMCLYTGLNYFGQRFLRFGVRSE